MRQFRIDDLVICRNVKNKEESIYARVVNVDRKKNTIELDKYLRQGEVCCKSSQTVLPYLDEIENSLYQPMSNDEITSFHEGLTKLYGSEPKLFENLSVKKTFNTVLFNIKMRKVTEKIKELYDE